MKTRQWLAPSVGMMVLGALMTGCGDKPTAEPDPVVAPKTVSHTSRPASHTPKTVSRTPKAVPDAPQKAEEITPVEATPKPPERTKTTPKPETPKMAGDAGVTETVKEKPVVEKPKAGTEQVGIIKEAPAKKKAEARKSGGDGTKAVGDSLKSGGDAATGLLGGK